MSTAAPLETLIPAAAIATRIRELGSEITAAFRGEPLSVLVLMKGSLYFAADLTRAIALPLRLEFLTVSSYYDGTESSGAVHCSQPLPDVSGRHVLLLDDILDTGLTLREVAGRLAETANAKSIRSAVLLRKAKPQVIAADWVAFDIADQFVVGYGLDHAQECRNLPDICVFPPSR